MWFWMILLILLYQEKTGLQICEVRVGMCPDTIIDHKLGFTKQNNLVCWMGAGRVAIHSFSCHFIFIFVYDWNVLS